MHYIENTVLTYVLSQFFLLINRPALLLHKPKCYGYDKKKKKVLQPARITLSVRVSVNDCMHEFV